MPTPLKYEKWVYVWAAKQYGYPWKMMEQAKATGEIDDTMGVGEGFVETNQRFCEVHGAVLWDQRYSYPLRNKPVIGYIYDANYKIRNNKSMITHKAEIKKIIRRKDLKKEDLEYLPRWRKQCYYGNWKGRPRIEHELTDIWFLISKISLLNNPISVKDLVSWNTGKHYTRDYVYGPRKAKDPEKITIDGW